MDINIKDFFKAIKWPQSTPIQNTFEQAQSRYIEGALNEAQRKSKKKVKGAMDNTKKEQLFRMVQQMNNWRAGVAKAEDINDPDRTELIRTFKDMIIDDQVSTAFEQRVLAVMGSKWNIKLNDKIDEDLTKELDKAWLEKFVRCCLESIMYGFSLVQFKGFQNGDLVGFEEIPREYVIPEEKRVKEGLYQTKSGIDYTSNEYKDTVIMLDSGHLGLLFKITPLVIWKKNALIHWSQYGETFGNPLRVGRTDIDDSERKENMRSTLSNVNSRQWALIDTDDEIEFVADSRIDAYNVFDKKADRMDKAIARLILGQTATMEEKSFVGSAEVQERVKNDYTSSDKKTVQRFINEELFPRLMKFGVIPEGAVFAYDNEEKLSFDQKLAAIEILSQSHKVTPERVKELIGVEVEEKVIEDPEEKKVERPTDQMLDQLQNMADIYSGAGDHNH